MTTWATPEDVESATQSWSEGQVQCRIYGHSWRPFTATHRPGSYTIYQRCQRCANQRWMEHDERGYPLTPWSIRYEEGYLLHKLGRVGHDGKAVLRMATLRGLLVVQESEGEEQPRPL